MDEKVIEFFAPAAKLVLERGDKHDAMCRALAALSGLIEVPKPRRWAAQHFHIVISCVTPPALLRLLLRRSGQWF